MVSKAQSHTTPNELRVPTVPHFPLSSPITEEVASPTSSSEDNTSPERSRPLEYLKVSSQNPFISEAELATSQREQQTVPGNVESPQDHNEEGLKPPSRNKRYEKPKGLNLVTDFTLSPPPKPRNEAAPPFVDLHDLKVLSKVRENERKIKGILKKGTGKGFQRLSDEHAEQEESRSSWLDAMKPRKNRKDELSPSDRPIMIGFNMSRDGPSESQREKQDPDGADGLRTPLTPSIVVTPAKDDGFWDSLRPVDHRPRATSSIYSQPTPWIEKSAVGIPPVPAIPAEHASGNEATSPNSLRRRSVTSVRKQRAYSTGTVFEDDDVTQPRTRSRSYSNESAKKAFNRLTATRQSVNSEVNKHYSQGWWTYLLSPLLGARSNTMTSRKTPVDEKRPPVPTIATNSPASSDEWWRSPREKEISCFSPDTPETAGLPRGGVASWQNNNWNPFADFDSSNVRHSEIQRQETSAAAGGSTMSFMFPGHAIQGCAAEYYQACAHELFSGKPYFECFNHVCSLTPQERATIAGAAAENPSERGVGNTNLLVDVDDSISQAGSGKAMDSSAGVSQTGARSGLVPSTIDRRPLRTTIATESPNEGTPRGPTPQSHSPVNNPPTSLPMPNPNEGIENSGPPPESHSEKQAYPVPFVPPENATQPPPPPQPPVVNNYFQQFAPEPRAPFVPPQEPPTAYAEREAPQYIGAAPPVHMGQSQAPDHSVPPQDPPTAYAERAAPQYIQVAPPHHAAQQPQTPGPISPAFQRQMEGNGSIPMNSMDTGQAPAPAYTAIHSNPAPLPPRMYEAEPAPITREVHIHHYAEHSYAERDRIEQRRRRHEKEDKAGRKCGGLWRGRGCISNKGCFGRQGREGRLRRRWYIAITFIFVLIILASLLLAILLTRRGDATPVQSQWLNLTGYPPMPTGIATIAGPKAQVQKSGCITPGSLWSCALPNEQHEANKPYAANEPNFRVEIRFRNGTYPNSTTVASRPSKRGTAELYNPSPAPPSSADQAFLGNTTDKNSEPYAGEETPFFLTMLSSSPQLSPSQLTRRSDSSFPDIESLIPDPDTASDGTAADANLYPLPSSQPVRLYNRGQDTEHYGFYTYFDRSIFLETTAPLKGSKTDTSSADANGGPSKANALVRCTWAQTRFLVQIWTAQKGKSLLPSSSNATSTSPTPTSSASASASASSSATDFTRPGSFPYPVTITLDRHGGSAKEKMVYCYGMETGQRINATAKKLQVEDRGVGGTLVNAAPGIFNLSSSSSSDLTKGWGGVDGGSGGCECQWRNWIGES